MKRMDKDNRQSDRGRFAKAPPTDEVDGRTEIKNIMKDIELLGSTHMTWKEKKALENRKVVSLGGKPKKQQRLPLSVAKGIMKCQKKREEKMKEERMILGCFGGSYNGGSKKSEAKRRPEDRVLKSIEGNFRNGVLNVKHLMRPDPSKEFRTGSDMFNRQQSNGRGKGKGKGKKNKGKKGGGKKRH